MFGTNINVEEILRLLIIFAAGLLIIRAVRVILRLLFSRKMSRQAFSILTKIFTYSGYAVLTVVMLGVAGIKLTAVLGAAGILGIAIGVASQKSLGNFISGIFLVTEKSFEIGDVLRVNDQTGIVYSIDFLAIKLKTFDNLLIRIPNETLISADITNVTRFPIRRLDFLFSVSYKDDLQKVREILESIAKANTLCLDEPVPLILFRDFTDSGISLQFGIWFEKNNYADVKNSVITAIKSQFETEGITIPFRQITIHGDDFFKTTSSV